MRNKKKLLSSLFSPFSFLSFLFSLFSLLLPSLSSSLALRPLSHKRVVVGVVHHSELVDLVRARAHGDAEGAVGVPAVAGGVGVGGEGRGFFGFGGGNGDLFFGDDNGGSSGGRAGEHGSRGGPQEDAGGSSGDDGGCGSGFDAGVCCCCCCCAVGRGGVREEVERGGVPAVGLRLGVFFLKVGGKKKRASREGKKMRKRSHPIDPTLRDFAAMRHRLRCCLKVLNR